jgi:hypothetical protein
VVRTPVGGKYFLFFISSQTRLGGGGLPCLPFFPGIKRPRRGFDHPLPSSVEFKNELDGAYVINDRYCHISDYMGDDK